MNAVAHPFFSKCGEIINTVSGKMNDHNSYYINNVGLKSCNGIVDENSIEECVHNYLRMYIWTFSYMCNSVPPTYNDYYHYKSTPLVQDIVKFFDAEKMTNIII